MSHDPQIATITRRRVIAGTVAGVAGLSAGVVTTGSARAAASGDGFVTAQVLRAHAKAMASS
jgi:hypothetical protein